MKNEYTKNDVTMQWREMVFSQNWSHTSSIFTLKMVFEGLDAQQIAHQIYCNILNTILAINYIVKNCKY